ncbi:lamin tail domain-containing protein [Aridibaculum aurantiacum]|uniref:lamin tail domain-containing protein n=1 Tax=Aridibaculum aurantiacum TaxID=2810307 RepID=UPI001A95D970|nr:lamin tail domain-containing protein [Aridibaculum aurantiacum]
MKNVSTAALVAILILFHNSLKAQFTDNFSDGDFTSNPTWVGNTNDWMVNSSMQLQSNNTVANSTYYLSTANTLATAAQWDWFTRIEFNPSGPNSIDVYLTASASDLASNSTVGYFVRIGNTDDEIALYRKDAGGTITKIIDGANGILNSSASMMKIRVIRTANNQWSLLRDLSGTGTTYVSEGTVTDATYTTSSFFGILVRQSTASFFQKHFFDDFEVKAYVPDVTPPAIVSATAVSPNTIDVLFNEPVDLTTSQVAANYSANNGIGSPTTAVRDAANTSLVRLTFANNFPSGPVHTLTINNVQDLSGNAISNGTASFSFYIPKQFDIVIDELMPDPSPVVSLPNTEWVELKNTSGRAINLQGWRITTASATSGAMASYVLPADSFVVITSSTQVAAFAAYGRVLGVSSFPALPNEAGTVSLISREGATIHTVSYSDTWYQNAVKKEGGWTLEMIDTRNPCNGGNNWRASVDPRGGTPGAKNSIDAANPDQTSPSLVRAAATDNLTVVLTFSEPVDSARAATASNYTISDGVGTPVSALTIAPAFNRVQLRLATPLQTGRVYTITANNVADCSGNTISSFNTARVGLPSPIDSFSIVINEVLFNPPTNGVDYVEIYNRTNNVYDLKDLYINNRAGSTLALGTPRQVSTDNLLLFPGEYFVLSPSGEMVKQQFNALNPQNFVDVASFPSYPNDRGYVVLMNAQGIIVDELAYSNQWHYRLLDNEKGVALERIDFNRPTQDQNNWHSAASTSGFGTPSYQNSQYRADVTLQGEVTITPKTFSPDNDGYEDFTVINYRLTDPGYVANITIFDAAGRPVRLLAKNATLGLNGSFRWDGLNDKQARVPIGAYVVYTEVFNIDGKKRSFKNTVVVAARF